MKSLNDYFDKIYCIHITGVEDRKKSIEQLSKDLNCEINFFEASTPKNMHMPNHIKVKPGEFGCAVSHLRLFDKIKKDAPKRPLILEDDAFAKDINKIFNTLEKIHSKFLHPSVDLAYLGVNYRSVSGLRHIQDTLYKMNHGYTTHAYSPSIDFLKKIHKDLNLATYYEHPVIPIDVCLARLMPKYNCMTLKPSLFSQKKGYSFVQNKHVDFRNEL